MRSTPESQSLRAAAQQVETSRLLGVDFVPVAMHAPSPEPDAIATAAPAALQTPSGTGDKQLALDELRARYEKESPLVTEMQGWTNIVFGVGDPDARLMFVGEAPGADEDAQGVPFVGRSGQLLTKMIEAMGLTRDSVYIANVLKVRPPGNRTPTLDEASKDGPFLLEQIRIIEPEVIVTLGKPAANLLLENSEAMGRMRGKWHEYAGVPLMPTYHPAFLLRSYTEENRRKVWSDLTMAIERLGLTLPMRG